MTSLKVCGANDIECSEGCPYYAQTKYQDCSTCQIDDMEIVLPTLVEEWKTLKISEQKNRQDRVARWLQEGRTLLGLVEKERQDGN